MSMLEMSAAVSSEIGFYAGFEFHQHGLLLAPTSDLADALQL